MRVRANLARVARALQPLARVARALERAADALRPLTRFGTSLHERAAPLVDGARPSSRPRSLSLSRLFGPPRAFVVEADRIRARHGELTYPEAVELFKLAADRYRLVTHGSARRRRGWGSHIKRAGDRYIVECLHCVDGIGGHRVRASSSQWTLAQAMAEAFYEGERIIERAWERRPR